eukprot:UN22861
MIAWFILSCYPYGTFYLLNGNFFIKHYRFTKANFRFCSNYNFYS